MSALNQTSAQPHLTARQVPAAPRIAVPSSVEPPRPPSSVVRAAQRVIEDLFGPLDGRQFSVRYWDGTTEQPAGEPIFELEIRRPSGLRRMLLPPSEIAIAEAYLFGDIDVHGDMATAASLGDVALRRMNGFGAVLRLLRHAMALPSRDGLPDNLRVRAARGLFRFGRAHSARRDAKAVRFHYDVGNDFYSLWLDRQLVYSCGYFVRGDEDLENGQTAKLDYVCRKLRLRAGERLLDIGCGWGALVVHAARHYGVRATGITLSEQQAAYARDRVAREGLSERVRIELRDYRDLGAEQFDKIASVGMVEHVGLRRLGEYFAAAYRALKPGGLFLNHGIVSVEDARPRALLEPLWSWLWRRDRFIRRYVFPDGELVPAAAVIANAERQGFELRDVESLREHYVTTLRHWVRRLEEHEAAACAAVGDFTYRVWRLYLSASARAFRGGDIGVIQSLLARQDAAGRVRLPRSRADLYACAPPAHGPA